MIIPRRIKLHGFRETVAQAGGESSGQLFTSRQCRHQCRASILVGIQIGRLSVRVYAGADSVNELGIWVYDRK